MFEMPPPQMEQKAEDQNSLREQALKELFLSLQEAPLESEPRMEMAGLQTATSETPPAPDRKIGWKPWAAMLGGNLAHLASTKYVMDSIPDKYAAARPSGKELYGSLGLNTLLSALQMLGASEQGHGKMGRIMGYASGGLGAASAGLNMHVGNKARNLIKKAEGK